MHAYWYAREKNFGDGLTPYLLRRFFSMDAEYVDQETHVEDLLFGVGSILFHRHKSFARATIWGSGLPFPFFGVQQPKQVAFVRGPLTASVLKEQGIDCPPYYADPAVLIAHLGMESRPKRYRCGIVPNHAEHEVARQLMRGLDPQEFVLIDMRRDVDAVLEDIASCQCILSSALHGLIAADALGIPNNWCAVTPAIIGMGFKFHDYYASLKCGRPNPVFLNHPKMVREAMQHATTHDLSPLLACVLTRSCFL